MKGITREFSVARTPQQNGVAERKNRILIEVARTMLADLNFPTTFWAEAVNTACYVQNRVLIIKPYNKTPYELFLGRKPALSFMRPFGCPVTIYNTLDHLDYEEIDGGFVAFGGSTKGGKITGKDFKLTDESHVLLKVPRKDNMYSIDLKNVIPQRGKARVETVPGKDYILLPLWTQDPSFSSSLKDSPNAGFKPSGEEEKKDAEDPGNEDNEVPNIEEPRVNQGKDENVNSTNNINTVSLIVNTTSINDNAADKNIVYECADDPNMPNLEETVHSDDDEGVGTEADMTNLDTHILVSPIPTIRIHKDRLIEQIIRDIHSAPQTRRIIKRVTDHVESKKVIQALTDPSWI
ncbi:ribonuclease H-like domain-containing protein, partial [Tanacetum coccineum]